ncbi:MAG: hypothetical protein LBU89_03630 [Fibromonadaceae bacterium]|jgi:hypothetical protein|nr:hypothetical protein [Fibromonadaceae bacterium]
MTVPNWKAERYLLGELPAKEMDTLRMLESDGGKFSAQLEQLRNSNEELLAKYPPKPAAEKMCDNRRKFAVIEPVKKKWLLPLSAAAAILICPPALFFAFNDGYIQGNNTTVAMNEDGTRIKGLKTGLEIWRKTEEDAEKLSNNSKAKAGDLLQVRYIAKEKCYGVILSMDGNGILTIHLAGNNGKAAELEAGRITSLNNAYELDDAPKFETFYLITANKEFELAPIAKNLLEGKLPKDLQVSQITLQKK